MQNVVYFCKFIHIYEYTQMRLQTCANEIEHKNLIATLTEWRDQKSFISIVRYTYIMQKYFCT